VLRHLEPLSEGDLARLRTFAVQYGVQWWLQPKGPDTVHLLDEGGTTLAYALPDFGITMPFKPTDFTQVNPHINRVLVSRALRLLAVERHERVIDWFCGLGNFTLPLATQAREVLGIEGSETLVARSRENYEKNKADPSALRSLCATEFVARNLFEMTPAMLVADGSADKWLVDPPREGAFAWPRPSPTCTRRASAPKMRRRCRPARSTGHPRSASSTSAATRRRWPATPACWCTWAATAACRPAWSTCSRTPRMWRAWRCSNGTEGASSRAGVRPWAVLQP
jgi:hypothetical protein